MSQKYSKKQLLDNLRNKYIKEMEREKMKQYLQDQGYSADKATQKTRGQQQVKKELAETLSRKSEREREKILKNMGFKADKRKEIMNRILGEQVSSAELKRQQKVQERIKKRNIAASKAISDQMSERRQGGKKGKEATLNRALTEKGAKIGHTALGVKGKKYSVSVNESKQHSQSDYYDKQKHGHQASVGQQGQSRGVAGGYGMKKGPSQGGGGKTSGSTGPGGNFGLAA